MRRIFPIILISFFAFYCGSKAPPVPPQIKKFARKPRLVLQQMGEKVYGLLILPRFFTSGEKVNYEKVEIKLRYKKEEKLVKILVQPSAREEFSFKLSKDLLSKKVRAVAEIEIRGFKKVKIKSDPFEVRLTPQPPENLKFKIEEEKVILTWDSPEKNWDGSSPAKVRGYRVYRQAGERKVLLTEEPLALTRFEDQDVEHNKKYLYFVTAIASLFPPYEESDFSKPLEVLYMDRFPPLPPEGFTVIFTGNFMLLRWEKSPSKDVIGYFVYRQTGTRVEKLTEKALKELEYEDHQIKKGQVYTYWVTAVDRAGNESSPSEKLSEEAK